jgi:hypothetical protein
MSGRNQYKAEQFIDAIKDSGGIVSTIAKRVGCDWHTAKKYIDTYPTVNRAYQDECERVLDLAETKVIELINDKDGAMIRYYLSTKGKKRGYTEKQQIEHTGKDGGPIEQKVNIYLPNNNRD